MKIVAEILVEHVGSWDPGVILGTIAFPANQIMQAAAADFGIEDAVNKVNVFGGNDG